MKIFCFLCFIGNRVFLKNKKTVVKNSSETGIKLLLSNYVFVNTFKKYFLMF